MRGCPVCNTTYREFVFAMDYKVPEGWPLPKRIVWLTCQDCGMLYGDGPFDQKMLNDYYRLFYGYGVNSTEVNERLAGIADWIIANNGPDVRVVDFGGSGDDGKSIMVERLKARGYLNATNVNAGDAVPECDILLASHVMEHVYDMPAVMALITGALAPAGLLIIDGPDATGIALKWGFPILDFHTKHISHFRMIDYLRLADRHGFELIDSERYTDVRSAQVASCVRLYFRRYSTAQASREHIQKAIGERVEKLKAIGRTPVNVWGLGDITWHLLAQVDLNVLNYIDNDPAYRGALYNGKKVVERPENDCDIVICAQGQRQKLIANIRSAGITNTIIEI